MAGAVALFAIGLGGSREDGSTQIRPGHWPDQAVRSALRPRPRGVVMGDVLIWGALALMVTLLVAIVLLILRWDRDRQAEVEQFERADVNALIEANPVSAWAPGVPANVIIAWEQAHR